MHIIKSHVHGNPNVGLFGIVTQGTILFGEKLRKKQQDEYEEVLNAKLLPLRVAGTDLPGVMLAANSNALLVPHIMFDQEKSVLDAAGIKYEVITTNITCLGNTIACTDHGALISTEFSEEEAQAISDALKVPCVQADICGLTTPGAVIVTHEGKAVIHKDATEEEAKLVAETLKVTVEPATINLGSPHLRAGILHSDDGIIVGDLSGGPEIIHIDEVLGYHEV